MATACYLTFTEQRGKYGEIQAEYDLETPSYNAMLMRVKNLDRKGVEMEEVIRELALYILDDDSSQDDAYRPMGYKGRGTRQRS